ncbi:MAG: DUF4328 domain-containing protein [Bacteroidetes bacterium]|nr:DUF4328 domain-containing protein [Bacteroidota bacterium]MCL1968213.1 DUF4328 domain-containing protein [Bacteroidota bacterium]
MKKITNNAFFGKLAVLFNVLILGMFIVSMFCLLRFDKVNVKLVREKPAYEKAESELRDVEKPRRQAQAEVDYYDDKLNTLKQQPVPENRKLVKEHQEEIERTENTLAGKQAELAKVDDAIQLQNILFEAVKTPFDDLTNQVKSSKNVFSVTLWLTIILFVAKILLFGTWNYKNLRNLRITSPWMKKSSSPYWAYLGWFIPVYNFFKPYMVFSEVYNESNYILLDKNIIKKDIDDNADFNLGLWWGLLIIAVLAMSFVLSATFFKEGPMFYKLPHASVAVTAIVFWILYLIQESVLIFRGVKMNQILFENHPKFDLH